MALTASQENHVSRAREALEEKPHAYVPAGPLGVVPAGPFQLPDVRLEAFAAVLAGVDLGDYDHRVIAWLAGLDDTTCRTVASIMWRCRQAGQQA